MLFLIVCLLDVVRGVLLIFLVLRPGRRLLIGILGLPLLLRLLKLLLPHLIESLALLHDRELRRGWLLLLVWFALLIVYTLLADRLRGLLLAVVLMGLLAIVVVLVILLLFLGCRLLLVVLLLAMVVVLVLLLMVLEVLLLAGGPFGAGVGVC